MPFDLRATEIVEVNSADEFEISEHIASVCCCTSCSDEQDGHNHPVPDFAFDLAYNASAGSAYYQNQHNKPSFDWDQAAEQISRWNAKWDDDVAGNDIGSAGSVTFGFLATPGDTEARAMSLAEIARTLEAIAEFEDVANLTFTRVQDAGSEYIANSDDAEMDFQAEDGSNGGYATPFWQNGTLQSSTVHIGVDGHADYGSWSYKTTIHEIGHAVGLPHPGDYNGAGANGYLIDAEYAEDTYMYTVMSYFSHAFTGGDTFETVTGPGGATAQIGGYATGLLLHDIAALQRLYGANLTTRTGDTVYGFNSTEATSSHWHLSGWQDFFVAAIWDAGGNDTIDASGYYENSMISLVEESFSSLGGLTYNLSIARGAVIENAIGGFGDDRLIGNSSNNTLDGGDGLDTVDFSAAASGINFNLASSSFTAAGIGTDTLISIEGVVATDFDDVLTGTNGDNYFEMLGGNDTITGGGGTDWISLNGATSGLTISADTLSTGTLTADGLGTNTFSSIEGIEGTQFADTFNGDDNQQLYRGGAGDDTFVVSAGADSYDGGDGMDTLDFRASTSGVEIHLGTGSVFVSGSFGNFTQIDFEHAHMTNFNDWINATGDDNIIYTYDGDDFIYAQQGDDFVDAGAGDDLLAGWYGNDTLIGGAGNDDIDGSFGDDTIDGGTGADTIEGGDGIDIVSFASATSGVVADLNAGGTVGDANGDTYANVENFLGSQFNDTLIGDAGSNELQGGAGDDILEGKGGADALVGGSGVDTVDYRSAGSGIIVDFLAQTGSQSDAEGDTYTSIENAIGSNFNDIFVAGDADNSFTGGSGADTYFIRASASNDTITDYNTTDDIIDLTGFASYADADAAFASAETVNGNTVLTLPGGGTLTLLGVDAASLDRAQFRFPTDAAGDIIGDDQDNVLTGTSEDNIIDGLGGNDTLLGLGGADTLNGGNGNDILNGGDAPVVSETQSFVYRLYLATLDRAPDAAGLQAWVDILESGANTQAGVANGFVASTEFQNTYGALDNAQFVELLYNNVLGRTSDPAGLQGWLDAMDAGTSRADVVLGFSNSPEFIFNTEYPALGYFSDLNEGNLGAVFRAYGAVLDRSPDEAGFRGWVDNLDSGALTLQQVIDGFTGSQEFQSLYGSLNDTEFVTLLYNNVLNRSPDSAGLQGWLDAMDGGLTRAQVVLGFSQSAEYIASSDAAFTSFVTTIYADSADTLDGGAQSDILFGGRGADTFIFDASEDGSDTIYGLDQFDTVQLDGFGYASGDDAMSYMVQSGSDVVFSDQGVTITFANANLTEVSAVLATSSANSSQSAPASELLISEALMQPDQPIVRLTEYGGWSLRDILDEDFFV